MNHSGHVGHHHVMEPISVDHMDHEAHSGQMNQVDHSGHMGMQMYFHFGLNEIILFSFWEISTIEGLIGSMVGIFILALLYEGLKYFREFLFWKNYSSLQYRTVQGPAIKSTTEGTNTRVVKPSLLSKHHILQTFLHIIQVFVSYLLMLIFMTYNVWLCIAVVLGAATGYFLFGWKKALFVDVTEHCH
ncbi:high affinity copper uptake protein 1-like isoform X2 [Rhodnius prolixus]|uniref:Copper transport protein n=2 Tax=Rhodnius TaxID=13248 RepID=R4FMH5_RHOPR